MLFDNQWSQRWDSNYIDYDSAADVPSWNCYVGEYPEPTVKALASEPSWSGNKAVLENGKYKWEDTVTTGLSYTTVKPEVGNTYTYDALARIAYLYDIGKLESGGSGGSM